MSGQESRVISLIRQHNRRPTTTYELRSTAGRVKVYLKRTVFPLNFTLKNGQCQRPVRVPRGR